MKLKKRIMLVVSMAVMTLSVLLSDMQVNAATLVGQFSIPTFNHTFPTYYGSISESTYHPFEYNLDFNLATDMQLEQYYLVAIEMPIQTGCTYKYNSSNNLAYSRNFIYGGESYPFSGSLSCVVVKGNSNSKSAIQVKGSITLNPYTPGDGYIYANQCDLRIWNSSNNVVVYHIPDSELQNTRVFVAKFSELNNTLNELKTIVGQEKTLVETYLPKLEQIESILRNHIMTDLGVAKTNLEIISTYSGQIAQYALDISNKLTQTNNKLDISNEHLHDLNQRVLSLYYKLVDIENVLINSADSDKNDTDSLKQNSDSQSVQLNNLNQQSQTDKIDVDNASGVVDQNLNINTDSNYGVLLSTFTSNGKILTMLLAVSSIGLISYVLFGKR